jgi:hypothetical protein
MLALVVGLVRGSPRLAAAGVLAIAADATLPQLRGFAAMRKTSSEPGDAAEAWPSTETPVTPSAA